MQNQQTTVPCSRIVQGRNPRTFFDPAEMAELETSIRAQGVLQPILVRPSQNGTFEIIAGERRWRAASNTHGNDYEMPVMIREMTDEEADVAALVENIQRADMSPTEEAAAAAKVLGRCDGDREEAARNLGWSRSTLDKRLALMNCSEAVQKALNERRIQLGIAELLAAVTKDKQDHVLEKLLASPTLPSVADLKAMLNQIARSLETAIFDKGDCATCAHNSSTQHALFTESIAAGNCTNGECFDRKTEDGLTARAEGLKEAYPVVRIVRAGENFTLLKLQTEGATGVSEDQAKACRACQKFGAAISAVPGKVGNVYKDLCFDASCNSSKVAERIKAEKAAAEALKKTPSPSKADGKAPVKAVSASTDKPATKVVVQDSNRIKEYRVKIWRKVLSSVLMLNPEKNLVALIALGITGNASKIDGNKMRDAFKKVTSQSIDSTDVAKAAVSIESSGEEVITTMHRGLVASAAGSIEERTLVQFLQWLNVDLAGHWKLNEEYLTLLTKSEMEVVADEIGLKAVLGSEFSKLMTGKKDEIIKALLNVEGFEYQGKVPKQMTW